MKRFAFVLAFMLLFFGNSFSFAQAQSSREPSVSLQRLEGILRDLKALEEEQRQILIRQDEMIAEVNNLKIWVRKR